MSDDLIQRAQEAIAESERVERESVDVLLTVKEFAALFHRHTNTVYRAIHANRLKYPVERPTGDGFLIRVPRVLVMRITKIRAA